MVLFDDEDSKRATVVVPDNKLSLAIGRRGQNVRLAAHLTGYRIDIKSASEYEKIEAEKAKAIEEAALEASEELAEDLAENIAELAEDLTSQEAQEASDEQETAAE